MTETTVDYTRHLGLRPVAQGQNGNIVTDSAGNLVIPVTGVISVEADLRASAPIGSNTPIPQHDARYGEYKEYIDIDLNGTEYSYNTAQGEKVDTKYFNYRNKGNHKLLVGFNMRNIAADYPAADYPDGVKISVSVDSNYFPVAETTESGEKIAYVPAVEIRGYCSWHTKSLGSTSRWDCPYNGSWKLADITIDFTQRKATVKTFDVEDSVGEALICTVTNFPDVTIEFDCDKQYCTYLQDGTVYTGSAVGYAVVENYIWNSRHVEISVKNGEEPETAIKKAAVTNIASRDTRQYIELSAESASGRFWRDDEADIRRSEYTPKTVYQYSIAGRAGAYGDILWGTEQLPYQKSGKIAELYDGAYTDTTDASDSNKEIYDADRRLVAKNVPYNDNPSLLVPTPRLPEGGTWWMLYSAQDVTIEPSSYGYMEWTGNSVKLELPAGAMWFDFGLPEDFDGMYYEYATFDGKYTAWAVKKYNQASGLYGAWHQKPGFGKWGSMWVLGPEGWQYEVNGEPNPPPYRWLSYVTGATFYHNGKFYGWGDGGSSGSTGRVFEADKWRAWRKSPCHWAGAGIPDEPIFTMEVLAKEGDLAFRLNAQTKVGEEIAPITAIGSGTYSITGGNGHTYYWSANLESETQTIDEEFE